MFYGSVWVNPSRCPLPPHTVRTNICPDKSPSWSINRNVTLPEASGPVLWQINI